MPIIATAGHVDHGKSTLVQALTGRDPDRWREEKERGLTIDLGFAWAEIGDTAVGFVDVPGHERFIKNMLAGVGGLDVALFVVAADEGWMPQSEEHLAVLDLLEVDHGVVALTRVDLAGPDVVELATLEVEEQLAGTSLQGWPLVAVSAVTGEGLSELAEALREALAAAGPPSDRGRPRLWIDRSFVIAGAGVVVTGTLLDGRLSRGDSVEIWPGPLPARIRALQSHESEVATAEPGTRVAANLTGLEKPDVARGHLLAPPGESATSTRFLVSARPVRTVDEIGDRGAYQLHAGSGAWPVRVRVIAQDVLLISAREAIPLFAGDRFILRETGRRAVVGGGRVLDPRPPRVGATELATAAAGLESALDDSPDELATRLLALRGRAPLRDLEIDSRGGRPTDAVVARDTAMDPAEADSIGAAMAATVAEFHEVSPLRPGIPKASLASALDIEPALLDVLVARRTDLVDDGSTVRAFDHGAAWSDADETAWDEAATELRASGLAAPRASQLGLRPELLHAAIRTGRLTRVAEDLAYLPEQLDEVTTRLGELPDQFTVAEFRDTMGISRRQAVPLLEWLDGQGWTTRRGDLRSIRRSRSQ